MPETRVKRLTLLVCFVFTSRRSYIPPESKTLVRVCTGEQFLLAEQQWLSSSCTLLFSPNVSILFETRSKHPPLWLFAHWPFPRYCLLQISPLQLCTYTVYILSLSHKHKRLAARRMKGRCRSSQQTRINDLSARIFPGFRTGLSRCVRYSKQHQQKR